MAMSDLAAVVFDLDGTLAHYTLSVEDAVRGALRRLKLPSDALGDLASLARRYEEIWVEAEEAMRRTGKPILSLRDRIWARLLAERGVEERARLDALPEAYGSLRLYSVRLMPGAAGLLDALGNRVHLGLLTNGPSALQWAKIDALGIASSFDAIVVSGDVGRYKPDPEVFRIALDRLGVSSREALHVGDRFDADIVGAARAGMRVAWIRNGDVPPADGPTPDVIVDSLIELAEVLL